MSNRPSFPATALPREEVLDLLLDAVCVVDPEGRFVYLSAACERLFGYTPEELVGRRMIELVHPDDRARTLEAANEIMAGREKTLLQNRYLHKSGRVVDVMWSARWSPTHRVRVAVARDVTARRGADAARDVAYAVSEAAHSAADLPSLCARIHQSLATLVPAKRCLVALADGDAELLSFPYPLDGAPPPRAALCGEVVRGGRIVRLGPEALEGLRAAGHRDEVQDARHALGLPLVVEGRTIGALVLLDDAPPDPFVTDDLLHAVAAEIARAIERRRTAARLTHFALYDPLTGLPNRALLADRFEIAIARARRGESAVGVLYIDLDGLKGVNDTQGHAAGDAYLQAAAARLRAGLRRSDTVARLGGDEFVALLDPVRSPDDARAVAEKLREALLAPVQVGTQHVPIRASIGVAAFPQHGKDAQELLCRADEAMYAAKRAGGDAVRMATAAEAA